MLSRSCKNAYSLLLKRKQFKGLSLHELYEIIEGKGFRIIEYKKYNYSTELKFLINKLGIEKEMQEKNSFLYHKDNLKLIFMNEDISDDDKHILLAHEIGHIFDDRISDSQLTYTEAQKEAFANEFTHYLSHPSFFIKALAFIKRKPAVCILTLAVLAAIITGVVVTNKQVAAKREAERIVSTNNLSPDMYYVTMAGDKYHKHYCKHVKYHAKVKKLSFAEAVEKDCPYEPCLDCIGNIKVN